MKEFFKKVRQIISDLFGKEKDPKELTADEKKKVADKYNEVFKSDMLEDFKNAQDTEKKAKSYDEAITALAESEDGEHVAEGDAQGAESTQTDVNLAVSISELKNDNKKKDEKIEELDKKIKKLGKEIIPDAPKIIDMKVAIFGARHTDKFLFGSIAEHPMFSLDKRWNKLMVRTDLPALNTAEDKKVFKAFQEEVETYGASLAARYNHLHQNGQLPYPSKKGQIDIDYSDLSNAGLGDQFVVRRQDALIARILLLPNIYNIFPRRYGIQDRELITNAFFGEFSQAWQTGEVWKGSMDLQPELGYVDDSMFKTLFESMKWLERIYIGYLNQEGSDPMKWTMVEWILLNIATVLTQEQYRRRILGIHVEPVSTEAGHYLHASTGFVYTVLRYIHENKLQPFTDAGLADYDNTDTNFVDLVIAFHQKIKDEIEDFQELQNTMYLNENHRQWYKSQVRAKYGLQTDFDGIIDNRVPDTDLSITWVPNMGQLKLIVVSKPGNFQALEYLPGEMFNIQFQPDMESVKSWSVWKEGFSASWVGRAFATPALLAANDWVLQEVFCNKPAVVLEDGATTADADDGFWFVTQANTGATVITTISNAVAGKAYVIECQGLSNASTIAKSGDFSVITAAWTPTVLGDYLMVVFDTEAGKFFDLERCVAGTRTINPLKQPNVPGNGGR